MKRGTPRTSLDETLNDLRDSILRMGSLLDRALERSMTAIEEGDSDLAQGVIDEDDQINELRFRIEETSLSLIARQQPAAGDLRQVVAALNIVLDLERIGDYAAGIAKTVLRAGGEGGRFSLPTGLLQMAKTSREMLRDVLKAYEKMDAPTARSIAAQDEEIDERYQALFGTLLDRMADYPEGSEHALYLLFAGHNLERVADRVTNVAERIVFMSSGELTELNPEQAEPEGLE